MICVELLIFALEPHDSNELSSLLLMERVEYSKYFNPFPYDVDSLLSILSSTHRDRYWGIRNQKELMGFFMLRGFDAGYERPSFGVFIAERFANHGLGSLALQYSLGWCRLNQVQSMMLKVHPDNVYARRTYEKAGFAFIGISTTNSHLVFEKRLTNP